MQPASGYELPLIIPEFASLTMDKPREIHCLLHWLNTDSEWATIAEAMAQMNAIILRAHVEVHNETLQNDPCYDDIWLDQQSETAVWSKLGRTEWPRATVSTGTYYCDRWKDHLYLFMWGYDNEPYKDDDDQRSLESCLRCDPRLTIQSQSTVINTSPAGKKTSSAIW